MSDDPFLLAPRFGRRSDELVYRPRPSVYAVIWDGDGRIALSRSWRGDFLPGGGVEPGEELEAALTREVREECAHDVQIGRLLGQAIEYVTIKAQDEDRHFELRATFFVARLGGPLECEPEDELVWLRPDEAMRGLFYRSHGWAIKLAEQRPGAV